MATEKRLIYAEDLFEPVDFSVLILQAGGQHSGKTMVMYEQIFRKRIEMAPTVDAVEVVRCKDCKHWHEETGWCTQHSHFIGRDGMACHPSQSSEWKMFNADDFCSYGERREGE